MVDSVSESVIQKCRVPVIAADQNGMVREHGEMNVRQANGEELG
jgi:hypothetical protein